MTLIENANRIYTDKEAIKQAIIAKGITVADDKSLDDYADLIAQITTRKRIEFTLANSGVTLTYSGGVAPTSWSDSAYSNMVANTNGSYLKISYKHNLNLISGKEYYVSMNLYDLGSYGFRYARGYASSSTTAQYWYTNVIPFSGYCTVGGSASISRMFSTKTITNGSNYCYISVSLTENEITFTIKQYGTSSAIAVRNALSGINCSLAIA